MILDVSPIRSGPRRSPLYYCAKQLAMEALWRRECAHGWVSPAGYVVTGASEVRPDLRIVRGRLEDYEDRYPEPKDVLLVLEVSAFSPRRERLLKDGFYARAGIPIYWVVNVVDAQVEVYSDPRDGGYRIRRDYRACETVPLVLDGREFERIGAEDLLP